MEIDLVLLSRDLDPPRDDVRRGITSQTGVSVRVHRVAGTPRPEDPNRWATIARARNEAKRQGSTPWVMFLDDDVVLAPDCVSRLLEGLQRRPIFAALGADYAGEMKNRLYHWDYPPHVGMGAVLFRRERLATITFRWTKDRCECKCCGDDLRNAGHAIGFEPTARATHLRHPSQDPCEVAANRPGRVLTAFNRAHYHRFRRQFLKSLRDAGNAETVTALAYDLRPMERRDLAVIPGVEVAPRHSYGQSPAALRIRDFGDVIADWPKDTPAAYWDAGDVIFQDPLAPLWKLVRENPDRLLAVREHTAFDDTPVVKSWVETIGNPTSRTRLLTLLSKRPIINGGFVAGNAGTLRTYFREAVRIRSSEELRGSTDWGDQTTLNVYCHTRPEIWKEIPASWNFCLYARNTHESPEGRIESDEGTPVHVAHGNGGSLGLRSLSRIKV